MKECVFCGKEFETLSCEHIIPNAICGHLKSNELLCTSCNNTLGNTIDKLLNGKFDIIINLFGLKREKGNPPPANAELISGRPCLILHGGQPIGKDVQIDTSTDSQNCVVLKISAPENNIKLLNMEISKYVALNNDLFRKHNIDYKKAIPNIINGVSEKIKKDEVEHIKKHEHVHLEIGIGGKDFYRAILKILYLFLLHHNKHVKINRRDIVNKIITGENISEIFFYCFDPENIFEYNHVGLYHSIGIKNYRKERKLLGFIDLFGIAPFICILDDNYDGEDVELLYGYDLIQEKVEIPQFNYSNIPLNLNEKYDPNKTIKERESHFKGKITNLFLFLKFYTIPERIIHDLCAAVNYDSSISIFLSELKTPLQKFTVSQIDWFWGQKEKGYALLHEYIWRGIQASLSKCTSR